MPKSVRLGLDLRLTPGFPGRETSEKTDFFSYRLLLRQEFLSACRINNLFYDGRDSNINKFSISPQYRLVFDRWELISTAENKCTTELCEFFIILGIIINSFLFAY